jgi:hypothetical protein
MKKHTIAVVAIAAMCLLAAGCASAPAGTYDLYTGAPYSSAPKNYFSDNVTPGTVRGEATSRVWLGLFGEEKYPAVERVAKEHGISRIATVEYYEKLGALALYIDYTTTVTGE